MSYNRIKRILASALLVAFTMPSSFALASDNIASSPSLNKNSMLLTGNIKLTESNDLITLSLRDSDVKQVLRMFADKAGYNIVFHNSVTGKVTLDLVNTPINEAFGLVLQIAGLNFYTERNTMIVMSKDSPDNAAYSKQEMLVFPIKYVSAAKIADFLNKNVFSMKKAGLSSVDAATVNSATNELIVFGMQSDVAIIEKVIEQFDKEPFTRTFSVNHTTPAEMANMICNMLLPARGISSEGSSGGGGGAAGIMTGGAAAVSSSSTSLKLGEGIVACSVSTTSSGQTVVPFDVQNLSIAYFPQRGTITMMGGSEAQAAMVESFIKANDVKQPQALLEVSIVELTEQGSKEFQNIWQMQSGRWGLNFDGTSTGVQRMAGGGFAQKTDYIWNGPTTDDLGSERDPSLPYWKDDGDGAKTLIIPEQIIRTAMYPLTGSTKISWQMNYLIQNRKARVLANPKIMITNGQESVIDLTQDYVEKVTSEYLTSSLATQSSTGTVQKSYTIGDDLGIKVALTPFISPEGYVTLNIKPEYSTVAGEVRSAGAVMNQTDLVATLLSRRDLDLKNIRIKDGETLVLGGMIQETEQKTVAKIPFLGDLPLIGPLFRSTSTSKTKNELVIMITPKILNDDEGAVANTL